MKKPYTYYMRVLNKGGFTLPELLVSMAIVGVVMGGIYATFYSQQKSYSAQEQIVAMQQNLRVAMFRMEREIRMAGIDKSQQANPKPGITAADSNSISFTTDLDGDKVTTNFTYALADNDGDGDLDLERNNNLIAENIDALDFVYLDGASPPNIFATPVLAINLSKIRQVQVTVVARTGMEDPGYRDTGDYKNQQDQVILAAQNDGFRRRVLTMNVGCRNL